MRNARKQERTCSLNFFSCLPVLSPLHHGSRDSGTKARLLIQSLLPILPYAFNRAVKSLQRYKSPGRLPAKQREFWVCNVVTTFGLWEGDMETDRPSSGPKDAQSLFVAILPQRW
jgi:hypothetical protein